MATFEDKVAIIVGNDSVGAAGMAARALLDAGASVFIADEKPGTLAALAAEFAQGHADGLVADKIFGSQMDRAFEGALQRFGHVEFGVCVVPLPPLVHDGSRKALAVLSDACFHLLFLRLTKLGEFFERRPEPGLLLVLVSWPAGEVDPPAELRLHLILGALTRLIESFVKRWSGRDIRVNLMCILGHDDDATRQLRSLFPAPYDGDPTGTVAGAVRHLLSEDSAPHNGSFVIAEMSE